MDSIENLFGDLETAARKEGAQLELIASNSESFAVSYLKNEINKYSFDNSVSAGVRVILGRGAGFSTTEKITRDSLTEAFKEALQSARDLDKEASRDKEPALLYRPQGAPTAMSLLSSEIEKIEVSDKLKTAQLLEKSALEYDSRVQNVPYSQYAESKTRQTLMSTAGVHLTSQSGGISAYAYAIAKSGEDLKVGRNTGFFRQPQKLDAEKLAREAARRSVGLLGAHQPTSGKYPVILSNEVAAQFLGALNHHLSAKSLDEGLSLLKGKLGDKVFSEKITLMDDPFQTQLAGARPFDAEGAPSQKVTSVENGVLKTFLSNSALARKLSIPHTSHAARTGGELGVSSSNTVMGLGQSSFEDLLSAYPRAILITAVDGLHSGYKESTLDFSLPCYGYFIENGTQAYPLHQMLISGNLLSVLAEVEDLSSRYNETSGSVLTPDLLIPEMSIAGA